MSSSWVVKLPLADSEGDAVLVNVTAKKAVSDVDLDADLLATDGESAFKGKGEETPGWSTARD